MKVLSIIVFIFILTFSAAQSNKISPTFNRLNINDKVIIKYKLVGCFYFFDCQLLIKITPTKKVEIETLEFNEWKFNDKGKHKRNLGKQALSLKDTEKLDKLIEYYRLKAQNAKSTNNNSDEILIETSTTTESIEIDWFTNNINYYTETFSGSRFNNEDLKDVLSIKELFNKINKIK